MPPRIPCLICKTAGPEPWVTSTGEVYNFCLSCEAVTLEPGQRLSANVERERYLLHQTTVNDAGYRKFVTQLIDELKTHQPTGASGLDFGAGHQPVLAAWLREEGYDVTAYDPFFWPDETTLKRTYDFVIACEVVEHFHSPREEFARLAKLVRPGGVLLAQTEPRPTKESFDRWYYRRDPSHVTFYTPKTFAVVGKTFGFAPVKTDGRVSVLIRASE